MLGVETKVRKEKDMKKKIWTAVIALIILAAAFYMRPLSIEDLTKADLKSAERISVWAETYYEKTSDGEKYEIVLQKGDDGFDGIIEKLRNIKIKRSPMTFLQGNGTSTHRIELGDFKWEIHLGNGVSLNNFFGKMTLYYEAEKAAIFKDDEFSKSIMETVEGLEK